MTKSNNNKKNKHQIKKIYKNLTNSHKKNKIPNLLITIPNL